MNPATKVFKGFVPNCFTNNQILEYQAAGSERIVGVAVDKKPGENDRLVRVTTIVEDIE